MKHHFMYQVSRLSEEMLNLESWCETDLFNPFVPNLEAKSVVPELTTRDSGYCWWSLLSGYMKIQTIMLTVVFLGVSLAGFLTSGSGVAGGAPGPRFWAVCLTQTPGPPTRERYGGFVKQDQGLTKASSYVNNMVNDNFTISKFNSKSDDVS